MNIYQTLIGEIDAFRSIIENQNQPLQAADPQLIVAVVNGRMLVGLATHVEDEALPEAYSSEDCEKAARVCIQRLAARLTPEKGEAP